MKSIYSEPLLPQNQARQLLRSGDQTVDGHGRALERIRSVASRTKLKRFISGPEAVSLKKDTDKETQMFSQPRMSDLWYLWDVQEDPLGGENEETLKDYVETKMQGAKLVQTITDTSGSFKRRAFTMAYEWVPEGQAPSISLDLDGAFACLEFLSGDLAAAESTLLLGEETGALDDCREGGDLLPPLPARSGVNEEVLTHGFYLHNKDVQIIKESELKPFTITRKGIKEEDKFPTPGEYLGMAVRAWPNHAWFSQRTNPFIFSSNWFETNHYSSGIVEGVVDIGDDDFSYNVRIRGVLVTGVLSTDFLTYQVNDRVTLLKVGESLDDNSLFTETDMKEKTYNSTWRIIPITFFKE
jgi:hypothetical protein